MYSRNYGFSNDTPAKINLPPSYAGSAISRNNSVQPAPEASAHPAENIVRDDTAESEMCNRECEKTESQQEEKEEAHCCASCERSSASPPKKDKGLLSGIFSDMNTEDLILLGIIAALALGLADNDLLLVALVVAVVLM